jgi:hypothetical protein
VQSCRGHTVAVLRRRVDAGRNQHRGHERVVPSHEHRRVAIEPIAATVQLCDVVRAEHMERSFAAGRAIPARPVQRLAGEQLVKVFDLREAQVLGGRRGAVK